MPVVLTEPERAERAAQEKAQALVAKGQLESAVRLLDGYLARFDGDWGTWLYFAGLCARLGWKEQAVAAYRASSRQLEGEGELTRARKVLRTAMKVAPRDASLARDAMRLEREFNPVEMTCVFEPVRQPKPSPSVDLRPRRGPDPFSLLAEAPSEPKRTDPHFAIFDIIDAERKRTG